MNGNIKEIYFSKGSGIGINYTSSWKNADSILFSPIYQSREKLEKVTLEKGIRNIGNYTFCNCNHINNTWDSLINNREELEYIGDGTFSGCSNITGELSIPSRITKINSGTFKNCSGITRLIIPDSVTELAEGSFTNCVNIKYVKIPISLPMTWPIFGGNGQITTNIEEIYFSKGNGVGFDYVNSGGNRNHFGNSAIYQSREKLEKVTLEKGIISIGNYTFNNNLNKINEINFTGSKTDFESILIGSGNTLLNSIPIKYL